MLSKIKNISTKLIVYALLIDIAFIYLYPYLYILTTSLMSSDDLVDALVQWIPRGFAIGNYVTSFQMMEYPKYFINTSMLALVPTLGHVVSCSLAGYSFARFKYPGKEILFILAIFTLIIPPQTIIIPQAMQYARFNWMDTYFPLILPAFFGMGLKGALYIFIFRQYFRTLPSNLEDAARIDGCGNLRAFVYVILPVSKAPVMVVSVLSIVWRWNDYFEPMVYLYTREKFSLPMILSGLWSAYDTFTGGAALSSFYWPLIIASCMLMLLPPLIFYIIIQRGFVQGIERVGLVE